VQSGFGYRHGIAAERLAGHTSIPGVDATDTEAATLLLNAVAAQLTLDALGLAAGQAVAVTGAAGAVGGYAIQLARMRGLTVIADGGAIATVKGWSGPADRGIIVHPISAFTAATNTALLEDLRDLAEHGVLTLRTAGMVPASQAAEAHRRLAGGGLRGRIVLDFESPLTAADP